MIIFQRCSYNSSLDLPPSTSEAFLVLPGVDLGNDLRKVKKVKIWTTEKKTEKLLMQNLLELPLGLALGEVVHVIVLGRHPHQPLWLHVCARPEQASVDQNIIWARSGDHHLM